MRNTISLILSTLLHGIISGCVGSKPISHHQTNTENNNTVVFKGTPAPDSTQGNGEATNSLIFQGKNNLLEVILNKQRVNSKGKGGVLIIKGNGNIIKLDSLDLAKARITRNAEGDTLVLTGNNKKMLIKNGVIQVPPPPKPKAVASVKTRPNGDTVVIAKNKKSYRVKNGKVVIPNTRKSKEDKNIEKQFKDIRLVKQANGQTLVVDKNATGNHKYSIKNGKIVRQPAQRSIEVPLNPHNFSAQGYLPDFEQQIQQNQSVYFDYFQEVKPIKYALNYFIKKIKTTNQPQYYYQLGEMYNYGIGTQILPSKAAELYKFAAAKNHLLSIRRLGDLYKFGKFSLKPNGQLARYYYARGKQLGDMYCIQMLKQ